MRDNNVWVSDGRDKKNGKGHTVMKFSPTGKLLMTLGKPGVAGNGPDTFNAPSDILVAPNGDIFVADGHGGETNARIVKFTKDGKFIKAWGKKGTGPGEFDAPHWLRDGFGGTALRRRPRQQPHPDLRPGRKIPRRVAAVRPAERRLHRQERHALCRGFDSRTSGSIRGFKQGIRIGSVKDGKVTAYIPWNETGTLEGVAADDAGNVYGGFTNTLDFRKFVKR